MLRDDPTALLLIIRGHLTALMDKQSAPRYVRNYFLIKRHGNFWRSKMLAKLAFRLVDYTKINCLQSSFPAVLLMKSHPYIRRDPEWKDLL